MPSLFSYGTLHRCQTTVGRAVTKQQQLLLRPPVPLLLRMANCRQQRQRSQGAAQKVTMCHGWKK